MKLLLPLLLATLLPTVSLGSGDLPVPYPERALFGPVGAAPVAKESPDWEIKVSIDAKGVPLRAVLATMFESAKLQYAVDPRLDHMIYVSVKDVTLREAVAILNRLGEFEVLTEDGVWYASRPRPKTTPVKTVPVPVERTAAPKRAPLNGAISTQTILVDARPSRATIPMRVVPPAGAKLPVRNAVPKTVVAKTTLVAKTVPVKTVPVKKVVAKTVAKTTPAVKTVVPKANDARPALDRRVTTKLHKTDLRQVLEAFSTQTGVAITVDESVPRYKIDSFMKATSLKYALDRLCQAAGLKYESHGQAIVVTKD